MQATLSFCAKACICQAGQQKGANRKLWLPHLVTAITFLPQQVPQTHTTKLKSTPRSRGQAPQALLLQLVHKHVCCNTKQRPRQCLSCRVSCRQQGTGTTGPVSRVLSLSTDCALQGSDLQSTVCAEHLASSKEQAPWGFACVAWVNARTRLTESYVCRVSCKQQGTGISS